MPRTLFSILILVSSAFASAKEPPLKEWKDLTFQILQQAVMLGAFASAILDGDRTFKTPGEMGLRDTRIMERIYESVAKGGLSVSLT